MERQRDTEILEQREAWQATFQQGWLAHFEQTGERDWQQYQWAKNSGAPAGPPIDLARSRLLLISSAGSYLRDQQQPFDAANPLGDYTIRTFPSATALSGLAYAHEQYDHTAVEADPQVLVPLRHLDDLVAEGRIGALTPSVVSFMGYQPDLSRLIDELIPAILTVAQNEQADAALLVPS